MIPERHLPPKLEFGIFREQQLPSNVFLLQGSLFSKDEEFCTEEFV